MIDDIFSPSERETLFRKRKDSRKPSVRKALPLGKFHAIINFSEEASKHVILELPEGSVSEIRDSLSTFILYARVDYKVISEADGNLEELIKENIKLTEKTAGIARILPFPLYYYEGKWIGPEIPQERARFIHLKDGRIYANKELITNKQYIDFLLRQTLLVFNYFWKQ